VYPGDTAEGDRRLPGRRRLQRNGPRPVPQRLEAARRPTGADERDSSRNDSAGLTRMLVLRSGRPDDGGWIDEAVDVRANYQRLFGEAPGRPRGIAILTDADQTKTRAVGDYAAFRVCRLPG